MKLSEWAEQEGIRDQTAWTWFRDGKLPVPAVRTPSGTILVELPRAAAGDWKTVVCARMSSHDQRFDLDRQVARMTKRATAQAMIVSEVVTEVGSGMNGSRRKLSHLLADATATTIVVEHRDRATATSAHDLVDDLCDAKTAEQLPHLGDIAEGEAA